MSYFKREAELFRGTPLDEIVAAMDAARIERAVLTCDVGDPRPVAGMARRHPGRFGVAWRSPRRPTP